MNLNTHRVCSPHTTPNSLRIALAIIFTYLPFTPTTSKSDQQTQQQQFKLKQCTQPQLRDRMLCLLPEFERLQHEREEHEREATSQEAS